MAKKIKLSYTASVAFAVSVVSAVFLTATYSANPASSAPFTRLDRGFHGRSDAHVFVFGPFKETGQLFLTPKNVTTHTALSYPFEKAGDAATFSDFSVLVAGRDDAQDRGVIVRYTKNAQDVMVLADTYTFTGGDVIGLVHDDINNKLYMLDLGHREIRSAPYTMGSTIPTSWTTGMSLFPLKLEGGQAAHETTRTHSAQRLLLSLEQRQGTASRGSRALVGTSSRLR